MCRTLCSVRIHCPMQQHNLFFLRKLILFFQLLENFYKNSIGSIICYSVVHRMHGKKGWRFVLGFHIKDSWNFVWRPENTVCWLSLQNNQQHWKRPNPSSLAIKIQLPPQKLSNPYSAITRLNCWQLDSATTCLCDRWLIDCLVDCCLSLFFLVAPCVMLVVFDLTCAAGGSHWAQFTYNDK